MKNTLLAAAFVCLAFSACDLMTNEGPATGCKPDTEWGEVSISITDGLPAATKSMSTATESAIHDLQILVYNTYGSLVAFSKSGAQTTSVSVPLGVPGHTVYAVANVSDDLSACSTASSLISKVSYLKDNSLSSLQMIGKVENLTFVTGTPVAVNVTRFASRVEIDEITADFKAAAYKALDFKVKGIFLINVSGSCPYSQIPSVDIWYNQMKYISGDCNMLIADVFSQPVTIQPANGNVTAYSTKHYFYCYANPTVNDTHGGTSFSPRRTRLVVETTLGGTVYYYPIDIAGGSDNTLKGNTTYTITRLTVTGPGVTDPDDELNNGNVTFNITVDDWETGFSKTVTY